ncbi:MAG: PG0541 family transporter-associated protein [bacterium]
MKLLMVICPEGRRDQVVAMVEKHGVHSFTELPQVAGEGITGKHLGTQAWPGKSVLLFTVVTDEKKEELVTALRECQRKLFPGEGMKAFVLPAEEAI